MEQPAPSTASETPRPRSCAEPRRRSAFRDFYERHVAALLRFLCYQVRDEDRGDVANLAFDTAARGFGKFTVPEGSEREAAERSWILTIARNAAANWRRTHHQPEQIAVDDVPAPADVESETAALELARALLWTLPEHLRTIYLWHHLDGETDAEIAARLALPAGTVKSQLRAAQQALGAAIDRLCARERTKREDYLRGAMPLPFADAAGLASALRWGEAAAPPGAMAAPLGPRKAAPSDGRRAVLEQVPSARHTPAGPLPLWLGLLAAAGLIGLVVAASSHTPLRALDVSVTQEESASAEAISPVTGQLVPGATVPAQETVPTAVATVPAADPAARMHARRLLGRAQTALAQGALGDAAQALRRYETEHPDDPFPDHHVGLRVDLAVASNPR